MGWTGEELKEVDLGDRRLNKRAITLLDTLAAKPTLGFRGHGLRRQYM
ncbi:transposase DNA-binding-containing protein [Candidatus Accumulibacter phosphatis]